MSQGRKGTKREKEAHSLVTESGGVPASIQGAQKTFVVREMPKEIKREFLAGPWKFDEITEMLEVIINVMIADERLAPVDLENSGSHDANSTQGDQKAENTVSYDVFAIAWKRYRAGKGPGKKGMNGRGMWNRGRGYGRWQAGKGDDGNKKGGQKGLKGGRVGRKYDGHSGRDRGYTKSKDKGKGQI